MERKIIAEQCNIRKNNIPIEYDILNNNNSLSNKMDIFSIYFNKNKEKKYKIVLDTETTGFVGDIIQLAYIIVDNDNNIIEKVDDFIKDRIPTNKSTEIHLITTNDLREKGIEFTTSIKKFLSHLEQCKTFIGHNIAFDIKTILRNIRKFDINIVYENNVIYDIFEGINIVCTCTMSNKTKLETLYEKLNGKKFENAHNAMNDVIATFECYKKLT